jgi:peroxiredoxin
VSPRILSIGPFRSPGALVPGVAALAASLVLAGAVSAAEPPAIGGEVPDFHAAPFGGESISLHDAAARHKAVVLVFLSTVCPYANYFLPHLNALAESYGPQGVLFVGLYSNGWESRDEVAAHARAHALAFPAVMDEGHAIADTVGANRTPEALVIDSSARLRYRGRVMSKQESPELKRAIDAVLGGRTVRNPETKAFGCAIGG